MKPAAMYLLTWSVIAASAQSADIAGSELANINDDRAEFHYMMHCQGCHTPDGTGGAGVPVMRDFVGHFTRTEKGRAYLVRVPGSAYSVLDDKNLAEVLNWLLLRFSGDSLPGDFMPYSADEVAEYRRNPLNEIVDYREHMLQEIAAELNEPEVMHQ